VSDERVPITVPAFSDVLARIAHFSSFSIGGRLYTADYLLPLVAIDLSRLTEEGATVPALLLYWGLEAARARRFKADCDHQYRSWTERAFLEAKATPVNGSDKFPTDRQAEATYRIAPAYSEWHRRIDTAQEAAENAEAVYESLKAKQFLLKVEQELLHDEAGGSYVIVPAEPRELARNPLTTSEVEAESHE